MQNIQILIMYMYILTKLEKVKNFAVSLDELQCQFSYSSVEVKPFAALRCNRQDNFFVFMNEKSY